MYRVLIVDDEPYVVDWLSALLEAQTEPELDVCRAYSGADALNWLNRAKIDIVITDICMPDVSGISLAEKVRQNWPQCKVILLTAHAEFSYAYEAIKNNVTGYILKTEDDDRILEEVGKAVRLLDGELNNLSLLGEVQEQLRESMSIIQKETLLGILEGEAEADEALFRQVQSMGVDISPGSPVQLLIGRMENMPHEISLTERYRRIGAVKKIAEHYFETHARCYPVEYGFNKIAWIILLKREIPLEGDGSADADAPANTAVYTAGMLETIQRSCMETLGMAISFALCGDIPAQLLSRRFKPLDGLVNQHGADSSGFIIYDAEQEDGRAGGVADDAHAQEQASLASLERLKISLEGNRYAEFREEVEKICRQTRNFKSLRNSVALECYFSAATVLISYINQRKLAGKLAAKIDIDGLFNPMAAGSWANAADKLRVLANAILDMQQEDEAKLSNNIIHFIKEYIDSHFFTFLSFLYPWRMRFLNSCGDTPVRFLMKRLK